MRTTEKLAILTALSKAVREELAKTREQADEELMAEYLEDGVEKKALRINGEKVGEFKYKFKADGFEIMIPELFEDFAITNGFADVRYEIRPEFQARVAEMLRETDPEFAEQATMRKVEPRKGWEKLMDRGPHDTAVVYGTNEMVPGVQYRPKRPYCTQVTECDPKVIVPMLSQLGGVDALLLGGGE